MMMIAHIKLPLIDCYHIFSKSRGVYLTKNHYEVYSPQMVPTNPTGSWPIWTITNATKNSLDLNPSKDTLDLLMSD